MTSVHETFAAALGSVVTDGEDDNAPAPQPKTPSAARQAKVPDDHIARATARALGVPYIESLLEKPISQEFLMRVPISFARRHALVGLAGDSGQVRVVIADVAQLPQTDALGKMLDRPVTIGMADRNDILAAINAAYQQQSGQAQRVIEELDGDQTLEDLAALGTNEDLLDVNSRAPVIRLVNLLLLEAVKRRASDVHVQPYEDRLVVRFRIDGVLYDVYSPPKALQEEVVSRIKIMGGMNIAERRLAQDGRATVEVGDRIVDLRIATLPTCFGERAVIRLLDKSVRLYELTDLGMPGEDLQTFRQLIRKDHGIILVTGPTGSGKSTTLYAALQEINSIESNILTLEDPIEYRLQGISQTQISDKKGMTFASGLRHVLRQDPDIIMVGEIRDAETASMAIQSALTGHLVFSTLHTNDAAGAVTRLLDLGVEPYLVASSVLGVLAQRLVRRICPRCKTVCDPTEQERRLWGVSEEDLRGRTFYRGEGCDHCLQTGYRERVGIFELLRLSDAIRQRVHDRAKASDIKAIGVQAGMTSLRADGIDKAAAGRTTLSEVARVTGRDEF
jgi:general secretion pathway protein E